MRDFDVALESRNNLERPTPFHHVTLYLFVVGLLSLLVVPFLPWYYYGINFAGPSEVSLIYLFGRGFTISLTLYLLGVATSVIAAAVARRPVIFQGVLTAAFPAFIFYTSIENWASGNVPNPEAFTSGVIMALLGSVVLEASYFSHRRTWAPEARGLPPERPPNQGVVHDGIFLPALD